jgi:hypothetical protein
MVSRASETNAAVRSSFARESAVSALLASLSALVGTSFLCSYMVFHALHVAGRDPQLVKLLCPIPLFATCGASLVTGVCFGCLSTLAVADHARLLTRLPKILGLAVVLFTLEILIFP